MKEQETKVFHVSNLMKGQVSRDLFVFSFATYLIQIKTIHIAISFCFPLFSARVLTFISQCDERFP